MTRKTMANYESYRDSLFNLSSAMRRSVPSERSLVCWEISPRPLANDGQQVRLSAYRMWHNFHLTSVVSLAKSENTQHLKPFNAVFEDRAEIRASTPLRRHSIYNLDALWVRIET
jgi:hypothetical protein